MVISRAPVRVSFLGGGTDFPDHFHKHGGAVLATAINRHAFVTAQPFLQEYFDHRIRLAYRRSEAVNSVEEIQHPAIRATLVKLGLEAGLEMHVMADLPARTGLGSSSSFVVAMLQALHAHCGRFRSARDLADEAIAIERGILAEAGGWQDQIIAAHGGLALINFERDGSYNVRQLSLPAERIRALEEQMLLVYTGIQRDARGQCAGEELLQSGPADADPEPPGGPRPPRGRHPRLHPADRAGRPTAPHRLGAEKSSPARSPCPRSTGGTKRACGRARRAASCSAPARGFLLFVAEPRFHAGIRRALGDRPAVSVGVNAPGAQIIFSQR